VKKSWYFNAAFVALLWIASGVILVGLFPEDKQPKWLKWATQKKLTLGLDLQGGVRLVYSVEVSRAIADKRDRMAKDLVEMLKTDKKVEGIKIKKFDVAEFDLVFKSAADMDKLDDDVKKQYRRVLNETKRDKDARTIHFAITNEEKDYTETTSYEQAIRTVSNRIDGLGLKDTGITQRGADISIEIPGVDEKALERIKRIISQTAHLQFRIADDPGSKFFLDVAKDIPKDSGL
jgi:preprotein translocase subunit SecD